MSNTATPMRRLIRANGTHQDLKPGLSIDQLRELIGAEFIDTVNLRHLGRPLHVMLVDDHGYETETVEVLPGQIALRPVRARKPVNEEATRLYLANCLPGTTHQIVGDVVVVPDDDFA